MTFMVLYRTKWSPPFEAPQGFMAEVETTDEAEAMCEQRIAGADVVWVCKDLTYQQTLEDYYGQQVLAG